MNASLVCPSDILGATEPRLQSDIDINLPHAAVKLRRVVKAEGLTMKQVQARYNPDGCEAIAVIILQMLTPWTPSSSLEHLQLWGGAK